MSDSSYEQLSNACSAWYKTPAGEYALEQIQAQMQDRLSEIFGYFALETGALISSVSLLESSTIKSVYSLGFASSETDIIAENERLPIDFDSVDLVVGSHLLECSPSPHQALREIDRVLVSQGHCILIGFNPMAWWFGTRRFCKIDSKDIRPYFYGIHQIRDWCSLLGWEVLKTSYHSFRPAFLSGKLFDRFEKMEHWGSLYWPIFGNIYMIHARKLEVIRPQRKRDWEKAMGVLPGKVAINPTPRSAQNRGNHGQS